MKGLISSSRYLIIIPVFGSFLSAILLLLYGMAEIVQIIGEALKKEITVTGAKTLALDLIVIVDIFLLGTVLYITALGLYELFIDDSLPLPDWLEINTLDDLKDKLTGVIILVLAVSFLGQVVTWNGQRDLLPYGAGIALMIAALTYFLSQRTKKSSSKNEG